MYTTDFDKHFASSGQEFPERQLHCRVVGSGFPSADGATACSGIL